MNVGRLLIFAGMAIAALGFLVLLAGKLNLPFGRLPGDVVWKGRGTTVVFPWVTCLVISVVLSILLWLVQGRR